MAICWVCVPTHFLLALHPPLLAKNPTVSLSLSFPKKAEYALAFNHLLLTSRKKSKNTLRKDQNLYKTLPLLKNLS